MLSEDAELIVKTLALSENALSMINFVSLTTLPIERVASALDLLVEKCIFSTDHSYVDHESGTIVYMFADNDNAQNVFRSVFQ